LDNRRLIHVLHWHHPGAVWAMDHTGPLPVIDGRWPYLLAVRDLASGCQLAWLPVPDETAETTISALRRLFLEHGPPLVLKSDNGSGFIAEAMGSFLDGWNVRPLFSPPYVPEYNGSIEAGNGALKTRTQDEAACQGRDGHWTADDVEAARRMANELTYPRGPLGPTRQECFGTSPQISLDARAAFGRSVELEQNQERLKQGYPLDTDLGRVAQAQIDRVAIRRALVEHGYLTFTQRSITPSIKTQIPLNIS
jgi:transposase InsO family protein